MRKTLTLAIALASFAAAAAPSVAVIDGDTIYSGEEKIRIIGLDTPETYQAQCDAERKAGQRATNYLRSLVADGGLRIERDGRDRYGRTLARVFLNGKNVAGIMIKGRYAVAYDCPGGRCPRRIDWCKKLLAREP